jgi:hypothetical protein
MQKTPITIEEDLEKLEAESERDILLLVRDLEQFFDPNDSAARLNYKSTS